MKPEPPLSYNVAEAAKALGRSEMTIRRYIRDGLLPAGRYPERSPWNITAEALEDFRAKMVRPHVEAAEG